MDIPYRPYSDYSREELIEALENLHSSVATDDPASHPTPAIAERRFRQIIDTSPVPYALNDDEQNITYLNPAFIQTFGYDQNDIRVLDDWWPKAYPDEKYRQWVAESWQANLEEAKANNTPFKPLELNIVCKNGQTRTVLGSASPLTGSFNGNHLVILYDITDRKKVEQNLLEKERELTEIIDHLPSMIFLKEAKSLRYVRFNRAGEEVTGISQHEIIGKNDYDLFPKEQADFFTNRDRVVLNSGQLENIPDEPIDTPSGTRSLHTRKVAINDSFGKPKYLLGISDDITDIKKEKAERERLQRELQQVHKMESLGQLAGGIAHDFNNLLTIISGYTALTLDSGKKHKMPEIESHMGQVLSAVDRAKSLVSQMLSFSRIDQSDAKPTSLGPIVEDDLKMLRATLPSSIEITTHIEPELPLVRIGKTQVHQVLMNLAVNARDAMKSRGRLDIRLGMSQNLDAEATVSHKPIHGDWVELSVSDTGTGIESGIVNNIFTPFFTLKGVGEGTGMGLSVVYGIVTSHNGHILVESIPGKGSTFRLLFPPILETGKEKNEHNNDKNKKIAGKGFHMLVVDDEPSIANFLGELLSNYDYNPTVVSSSTEALALFESQPDKYSLILTDQTMPELTGIELIYRIRKTRPDMPAIVCSGYNNVIDPENAHQLNISFLQKPVEIRKLINTIDKLLTREEEAIL